MSAHRACACALPLLVLAACGGGGSGAGDAPAPPPARVALEPVVTGLTSPLDLQQPDDGSGRLFIVEQAGRIRIVQDDMHVTQPWLDIRERVRSGGETGLLGLAFHPAFAANGRFFVNYTRESAGQLQSVIAELHVSTTEPNVADPAETILLVVDQPFENHKGGQLQFGPDGRLYVALGDGGGGGDPLGNAQSLTTLLGKLLRIDVDAAAPYAVPPDNPFVGQAARGEIWAYGFRNPWRFSFDRATGRLLLGDVGQETREEVDLVERGGNYGWNVMEGRLCFPPPATACDMTGLTLPIADYGTDEGHTVIGGYVYRGARLPELDGVYVFGDFMSGRIWGLRERAGGTWEREELLQAALQISAFGQDQAGEVYVVDLAGSVFRLRRAS